MLSAQVRITRCSAGGFSTDSAGARVLQYNAGAEFAQLQSEQRDALDSWIEHVAQVRAEPPSGTLSHIA